VRKLSSWRGLPNNPLFGIFCYILRGFKKKRSGISEGGAYSKLNVVKK